MAARSKGEKWIRLLRAYGPVADNEAHQGELVDALAAYLDVPKLSFNHPARKILINYFPKDSGDFRNVVLTGTAGEGKTSLCFELVKELTGGAPKGFNGVEEINIETGNGHRKVTLIYDVTGWRKKTNGCLSKDDVALLERMAESSFGAGEEFFVLAVNDGQMHELFRALPENTSDNLRKLEKSLISLHASGETECGQRLSLVNLSTIPSEQIMLLCLEAVLDRAEWICLQDEANNPLFSPSFSLSRNYRRLNTPEVRQKLVTLARIADVTGHHLPTRGMLCLLSNALLGHPEAKDRVIRPGNEGDMLSKEGAPQKAALHRTLFGENLTPHNRRKREVYRFLHMLHIGEETTNDLDELFIFGSRDPDPELRKAYQELIAVDPYLQRNPDFNNLLGRYIRGDINTDDETSYFLAELAAERRRIFLQSSEAQLQKFFLWRTTVFHHAREYLEEILKPMQAGKSPARPHLRKLASGLNRIWTGLLLAEHANEVYFATGLDLTTSPISDIYLSQLDLDSDPPGLEVKKKDSAPIPHIALCANGKEFSFELTLPRFEFLARVADGAMPSSFSKESCADCMSLKQRCLRDLQLKANTKSLHLIEVQDSGTIQRRPIHLIEQ